MNSNRDRKKMSPGLIAGGGGNVGVGNANNTALFKAIYITNFVYYIPQYCFDTVATIYANLKGSTLPTFLLTPAAKKAITNLYGSPTNTTYIAAVRKIVTNAQTDLLKWVQRKGFNQLVLYFDDLLLAHYNYDVKNANPETYYRRVDLADFIILAKSLYNIKYITEIESFETWFVPHPSKGINQGEYVTPSFFNVYSNLYSTSGKYAKIDAIQFEQDWWWYAHKSPATSKPYMGFSDYDPANADYSWLYGMKETVEFINLSHDPSAKKVKWVFGPWLTGKPALPSISKTNGDIQIETYIRSANDVSPYDPLYTNQQQYDYIVGASTRIFLTNIQTTADFIANPGVFMDSLNQLSNINYSPTSLVGGGVPLKIPINLVVLFYCNDGPHGNDLFDYFDSSATPGRQFQDAYNAIVKSGLPAKYPYINFVGYAVYDYEYARMANP